MVDSLHTLRSHPEKPPEELSKGAQTPQESGDARAAVEAVSSAVEGLGVETPKEKSSGQAAQWRDPQGTATAVQEQQEEIQELPTDLGGMQALVHKKVESVYAPGVVERYRDFKSSKVSARGLQEQVSQLRKLRKYLRELTRYSWEQLRDILYGVAGKERYKDPTVQE